MPRTSPNQESSNAAASKPAERPTMADLARLAGVSKITISRALADSPLVNPATRERIQQLARERGYTLNLAARSLRLRRSHTIAAIVEMTPSRERPMSGPYPLELLGGLTQELTSAGYSVLLSTRHGHITPANQAADGVILLGQGAHDDAVRAVQQWRLPTVVWGAPIGAGPIVVGSDNRQAGSLVAEHFVAAKRRFACFLGDLDHAENAERYAGFSAALAAAGVPVHVLQGAGFTATGGSDLVRSALAEGLACDALFAASDLLAIGAIQALRDAGREVPRDVSVVGFDDSPLGAGFDPPLTSVHQDLFGAGSLLARKVLDLIEGKPVQSEMLPTRLVVRGS